jgi:hypothetical protein
VSASLAVAKARGANVSSWLREISLPELKEEEEYRPWLALSTINQLLSIVLKSRRLEKLSLYGAATTAALTAASQTSQDSLRYLSIRVNYTFAPDLLETNALRHLAVLIVESDAFVWPASLPALDLQRLKHLSWDGNPDDSYADVCFIARCRFPALTTIEFYVHGLTPHARTLLRGIVQQQRRLIMLGINLEHAEDYYELLPAVSSPQLSVLGAPVPGLLRPQLPPTVSTLTIQFTSHRDEDALYNFLNQLGSREVRKGIWQVRIMQDPTGEPFLWKNSDVNAMAQLKFVGRMIAYSVRLEQHDMLLTDTNGLSVTFIERSAEVSVSSSV